MMHRTVISPKWQYPLLIGPPLNRKAKYLAAHVIDSVLCPQRPWISAVDTDHRHSRFSANLIVAVWLALIACVVTPPRSVSAATAVESLEVFLVNGMQVVNERRVPLGVVRVFYVDQVHDLEKDISQGLPADKAHAHTIAAERIRALTDADKRALVQAWKALRQGSRYGIERVPAVVINGSAVVYGVSDIAVVLSLWRRNQ